MTDKLTEAIVNAYKYRTDVEESYGTSMDDVFDAARKYNELPVVDVVDIERIVEDCMVHWDKDDCVPFQQYVSESIRATYPNGLKWEA